MLKEKTDPNDIAIYAGTPLGLTKLEYMATHIAAGLAADQDYTDVTYVALDAIKLAKVLIIELNKPIE